jgi:hypothetical protein
MRPDIPHESAPLDISHHVNEDLGLVSTLMVNDTPTALDIATPARSSLLARFLEATDCDNSLRRKGTPPTAGVRSALMQFRLPQ